MKTREEYLAQAFNSLQEFLVELHAGNFNNADDADCVFIGCLVKINYLAEQLDKNI